MPAPGILSPAWLGNPTGSTAAGSGLFVNQTSLLDRTRIAADAAPRRTTALLAPPNLRVPIDVRGGNNTTISATSVAAPMPNGIAAGDLVFVAMRVGAVGQTVSQTGGTGTWDIHSQGDNTAGGYTYFFASRLWQAGDTAPTFAWATSNAVTVSTVALYSPTGAPLVLDGWATDLHTSVAGNSVTPNAATATGTVDASVVLTVARATTTSPIPTAFTYAPPTGWAVTSDTPSDQWTGAGNSRFSAAVYNLGPLSGTVAPGAETLTDGSGGTYFFSAAHALVRVAPVFVQAATARSAAASTTLTATFPAATTPGNLLVLAMGGDKNTGALTATGWTPIYSLTSASVSLYLWWKVSTGEASVSLSWATSSASGNNLWVGEYADPTTPGAMWQVAAQASHITDETIVTSWATGTTGAATAAGIGIAVDAADTEQGAGTDAWSAGWTTRAAVFAPPGGVGDAPIFVAERTIATGTTAGATFSYTGTADQNSGAVAVFSKVAGLQVDGSSPPTAVNPVGSTPTVTTASFTPPANSLLVVLWSGNTQTATVPGAPSITDNLGAHLTYTLQQWERRGATVTADGQAAIWTAPVTTSATMTVTVTTGTVVDHMASALRVLVVPAGGQTPAVGASSKGGQINGTTVAMSYTATAAGSLGFGVTADWDPQQVEGPGSGTTVIDSAVVGPNSLIYGLFRRTLPDGVSGATTTINATLPVASGNLQWAAVEITPPAGGTTYAYTVDDPAGLVDVQALDVGRGITDPAGFADDQALLGQWVRAVDDPAGLVDSQSLGVGRQVDDSAGLADSVASGLVFARTIDDPAGLVDALSLGVGRGITDPAGASDSLALDVGRGITDPAGHADSQALSVARQVDDSAGLADAALAGLVVARTVDDPLGMSDTQALGVGRGVDDPAGLVDSQSLGVGRGVTDSTGSTDTQALAVGRQVDDPAGLADAAGLGVGRQVDDPVGLGDSQALAVGRSVTDSAGLVDDATPAKAGSQTYTIDDPAGLVDALVLDVARVVTDSAGSTDTLTAGLVFARTIDDPAGLVDSQSLLVGRGLSDDTGSTDTWQMAATWVRAITDNTGITDIQGLDIGRALTDSAGLVDTQTLAKFTAWAVTVNDALALNDSTALLGQWARQIDDPAGLTDAAALAAQWVRVLTDTTGLSDAVLLEVGRWVDDLFALTDDLTLAQFTGRQITTRPDLGRTARAGTGTTTRTASGRTARGATGTTPRPYTGRTPSL